MWAPESHRRCLAAFTLIEMLLVVTLLGMVAVIGIGAFGKAQARDPLADAVSALQKFDARQRRESRLHGPQHWQCTSTGLEPKRQDAEPDERQPLFMPRPVFLRWQTAAPSGSTLTGRASPESLTGLPYTDGLSPDFLVELRDGSQRQRFLVFGLSGQWVAQE